MKSKLATILAAAAVLGSTGSAAVAYNLAGNTDIRTGFGDEIVVHHGLFGTKETLAKDRLGDGYISKHGPLGTSEKRLQSARQHLCQKERIDWWHSGRSLIDFWRSHGVEKVLVRARQAANQCRPERCQLDRASGSCQPPRRQLRHGYADQPARPNVARCHASRQHAHLHSRCASRLVTCQHPQQPARPSRWPGAATHPLTIFMQRKKKERTRCALFSSPS